MFPPPGAQHPLTVEELHADATRALVRANEQAVAEYKHQRQSQRRLAVARSSGSLREGFHAVGARSKRRNSKADM